MSNTIVVTGAAGFIGSHLCGLLLEKGSSVIGIDNFITGSKSNLEELEANKNFSFVGADICNLGKIDADVSQIYNLASPASPIDYQQLPLETLDAGSAGVKNMLELAREKNAVFLQASTSEIYGDPLEHPQRESYFGNVNPIGERSCYNEAKRFAEALVMAYNRKHKMQTRIARIFNTHGPRMRANDGRVIPNFITQALAGKPITVYGKGEQTRSFCYVSDLIAGLYALINSSYSFPVNIGNPTEVTILQLAEKIKSLTDSNSEIVFKPLPKDDPIRRKPDISLARKELRWEPKVDWEEGLKKTIEWFKGNC